MVHKTNIDDFLAMAENCTVFDVRSPGEYNHAHIPGAHSLPLFTDEERQIVGTTYKQISREQAIKVGLDYFGPKMRQVVESVEQSLPQNSEKTILVHCWRGGMRSAAIAWLLDLYGFKVYTLVGGYKAYRNWVIAQLGLPYPFKIIGGYTGSGKTPTLHQMAFEGFATIDLEGIAKHKGSAFGELTEKQPTQEMFDNILAQNLFKVNQNIPSGNYIWIEDESQRIGHINLPNAFWETIRKCPVGFLEIPFEERLAHIVSEYGVLPKLTVVNAINRIQKRLGGLDTKNALAYMEAGEIKNCFSILLKYYDKHYFKALQNRENWDKLVTYLPCETVDKNNYKKLI